MLKTETSFQSELNLGIWSNETKTWTEETWHKLCYYKPYSVLHTWTLSNFLSLQSSPCISLKYIRLLNPTDVLYSADNITSYTVT